MRTAPLFLAALAALLGGCVNRSRCCCPAPVRPGPHPSGTPQRSALAVPPRPPGPAAVLRVGATGSPAAPDAFARLVAGADVVAFGELHGHAEGAKAELALWRALAEAPDGRPSALALEFFEKDTQADLDLYLAGTLPEADLVKKARQTNAYDATHAPLVRDAKARARAVIAANAPRRLVSAYRKQAEAYDAWKAALPEADRALLPRETTTPEGPYRERFMALMGPERGPAFFKAQALWDDAMAESVADHRAAHEGTRVLLVVGGFHVAGRQGLLEKLAARRPGDRIVLVQMTVSESPDLALPADDRGRADLFLVVPKPPDEKPQP